MSKKKYLAKIIAKDPNGLQVISACCSEAKAKVEEIKFLKKNNFETVKYFEIKTRTFPIK